MSDTHFVWSGLEELKAQLRALPQALRDEGASIVLEEGNGAVDDIKARYARKSGELADSVTIAPASSGPLGAAVVVKSSSHIAWMYENGTQLRHTLGGASRGVMAPAPPARAFIPVMERRRRRMWERLADLVRSHGLTVTGNV